MGLFWIFLLACLVCGGTGALVAKSKDRVVAGFWLGFWFLNFGVIAAAVLEPSDGERARRVKEMAAALDEAGRGMDSSGRTPRAAPAAATRAVTPPAAVSARPAVEPPLGASSRESDATSLRQRALREAISRQPALLESSTADDLVRVDEMVAGIERELVVRAELDMVRVEREAESAARAQQEEQQQREEELRRSAVDAAQRAGEDAGRRRDELAQRRREQEEQRREAERQRQARYAQMNPVSRWFARRRDGA